MPKQLHELLANLVPRGKIVWVALAGPLAIFYNSAARI
jgi:hypothetical protein